MTIPKVKICGITRVGDALAAVEAGADALGFMFYRASKRHIDLESAAEIIRALPPFISRAGVFVDADAGFVERAIRICGLDTLQFHGAESPAFCDQFLPLKIVKAFRIRDRASLQELPAYHTNAWLLDSYVAGQKGGTGQKFNWDLALNAKAMGTPIILAGGLTPENVRAAVTQVAPYGLDVASGVETQPGQKDPELVRAFVSLAKG